MPEDMHEVTVVGAETVEATDGRRLVLALEDGGVDILHRCGGNARCATCRVEVIDGEVSDVTPREDERLSRVQDRSDTTRLSCQVRVLGDLTVEVRNRLSQKPELGDAGPRPIEWPADASLEPEP